MTNKQKIVIIVSWFILVPFFVFVFDSLLKKLFPQMSVESLSLFSFLGAISLAAFLLDLGLKKFLSFSRPQKQTKVISQLPQDTNELFVFYLNDWNIYGIRLYGNQSAFAFLSRQKIDWILPSTTFQAEERAQLLKRVKMANQKLYIIKDDPQLKKIFKKTLEDLFQEKKLDYAVLLQNKASFTEGFPAERYEILETRDLLSILLDQIESFDSEKRRKVLEKELEFEDKILKEATKNPFILTVPDIEIQMRPKDYWWWKKAQNQKEDSQ